MKENKEKQETKEKVKSKPLKEYRIGQIRATLWNNKVEVEGKEKIMTTIKLEKTYYKDDEWHTTNNLNVNDLPKAVAVLDEAFRWLSLYQDEVEQ